MNTKRIIFWICFVVVLGLIVLGLAKAMGKSVNVNGRVGSPAPISASDHVRGPDSAPVTLIEYSDFQCPACESYYPIVTRVLSEASTSVRFVYRHFPLPQHANAVPAALASEAAAAQGKFWEMYDLLFVNHTDWTELPDPTNIFLGYATTLGLNTTKFTADLKNAALNDIVSGQLKEGQAIGINSTPTFFVNGKAIVNPPSYEQFKAIIDAAASGNTQ